ncbi:twin-arginine translocase TatA/TatE family subunit [Microtetraspora fusca]|uniref:Twin-arginine translocase TatA/TatE family subunit n=1 Tax=Microtetraspora fusca TaxID=1997 RepID=A0ABW6V3R7_MICFU
MFLRNGLEPGHLLVLGLVLMLLLGSKKLPETARALGRSLRIFKNETVALRAEVTTTDAASAPAVGEPGRTSAESGPSRADGDR